MEAAMAENNNVAAEDEYVDVEDDANDDNAVIDAVKLVSTEDSWAATAKVPAKGSGRCTGADDNIAWMDGEVDCSREPNQLEGKGKAEAEEEAEAE